MPLNKLKKKQHNRLIKWSGKKSIKDYKNQRKS